MAELRGTDLHYTYPDGTGAVVGCSVEVGAGERVAVLGPNGSGKTTLLLLMAGLLRPSRGTVTLNGRDLWAQLPGARRLFGVVFQEPEDQMFNPTVYDEIAYTLRQLGLDEGEVRERVTEVADLMGLRDLLDRPPYRLSGGQMKAVAWASALAHRPEIVVADEPLVYLDAARARTVMRIMEECRGVSFLFATHDAGLAAEISDRVYVLSGGRVVASGPPEEVLSDEGLLESVGLEPPVPVRVYRGVFGPGRPPVRLSELVRILRRLVGPAGLEPATPRL